MTRTLTDRMLKGLKPPATGREDYFDAKLPGLHLRVSATCARSWRYYYRFHGTQRVLTWPGVLSLAEARQFVRDAAGQVARGIDPAAVREVARREARDAESVEALVGRFLDTYLRPKRRPAYVRETERLLRREVLPAWGRRKAREITRRDVKALLADIAARPAPITANRTRAALSKFFN